MIVEPEATEIMTGPEATERTVRIEDAVNYMCGL